MLHHGKRAAAGGNTTIFDLQFISTIRGGVFDTTYTANGVSIGNAPANGQKRILYVSFGCVNAGTSDVTGITCNGTAMTQVVKTRDLSAGTAAVGIWKLQVDSGTTANFVFSNSGGLVSGGAAVHSLITNTSRTVTESFTASDTVQPINLSMDTPSSSSFILAATQNRNRGASTWSGITEVCDFDVDTTDFMSTAISSFNTSQTGYSISATTGATGNQMAGVAVTIS